MLLFSRKPRQKKKYVSLDWHRQQQKRLDEFIKNCEKFAYIKIKDGRATGYQLSELPELQPEIKDGNYRALYNQGTSFIIPEEIITPYEEF